MLEFEPQPYFDHFFFIHFTMTTTSSSPSHYYLLTGDIGGTNSRMSLYDASTKDASKPLVVKYFRNAQHFPNIGAGEDYHDKDDLFAQCVLIPFLQHCWETKPAELASLSESKIVACLATAGVVMNNRVRMTNLHNLLVDGTAMAQNKTNPFLKQLVVCELINDFVAQGYGCLTLQNHEVKQLYGPVVHKNPTIAQGPKVCVGAGTGLGECYLTPNSSNNTYTCFPSEGGHIEYAPRTPVQVRMWDYLVKKFNGQGRISVERVVSGTGLANVYEFLSTVESPNKVDAAVHQEFLTAGDEQGRVVGMGANKTPGSLCHTAMEIMVEAYGAEVGACAVKFLATGGMYVTGGLTPKNIKFIEGKDSLFLKAYLHKGRVSPILEMIPLYAVMVEDLGVRGAHKKAQDIYHEYLNAPNSSPGQSQWNGWASILDSLHEMNAAVIGAAFVIGAAAGWTLRPRR